MTPSEQRFMDAIDHEGEAWFVPAQAVMVRRLETVGLVAITETTRRSLLRGSVERRAIAVSCRTVDP